VFGSRLFTAHDVIIIIQEAGLGQSTSFPRALVGPLKLAERTTIKIDAQSGEGAGKINIFHVLSFTPGPSQ
jgi:hypothetical protein